MLWRSILLLSALLAGSLQAAEGDRYMVEMVLWIDGEKRGTPILVVQPNELTSVEIGSDTGRSDWMIELLLEPPVAGEGAPSGATWLNLTVYRGDNGEWEPLADSLLGVPEGETGTMSLVDSPDMTATPQNSIVYLTAQASLLRPEQTPD